MTEDEKQKIIKQHSSVYDGYSTGNVKSNMTPLTFYDARKDKYGITVDNLGNVKNYTNHNINEISAKNLHYDEIEEPYNFNSRGPLDSFREDYNELIDNDIKEFNEIEDNNVKNIKKIKNKVNKSLDMFKRFKKYN